MLLPKDYIRRATSTIPFGYELSLIEGYLKPNPVELNALREVSEAVRDENISLGIGVDWLESITGKKMSRWGLLKHVKKIYG